MSYIFFQSLQPWDHNNFTSNDMCLLSSDTCFLCEHSPHHPVRDPGTFGPALRCASGLVLSVIKA